MRGGSGGLRYYHRNQQYSITAVSDGGGSVVERYAYSAYGQVTIADASGSVISGSAISNRYTYTGREWDEGLSLYHYRARMYDPVSGRFVSRDPIGFKGSKWNLFRYVSCNPIGRVDPLGLHDSPHNLHQQLIDRIQGLANSVNSNPCLAEVTGMSSLLSNLLATASSIDVVNSGLPWLGGAEATYNTWLNQMQIPGVGLSGVTDLILFHELIHAHDDLNDWFINGWTNYERAEALAYSAEFLLSRYQELQDLLSTWNDSDLECSYYEIEWRLLFNQFDRPNFVISWGVLQHTRPGRPADLLIAEDFLGLNFSADDIASCFPDRHCTHANYCELPSVNTIHQDWEAFR
jgi:RHS repeat-associated protein